jgi:hypothetical protein
MDEKTFLKGSGYARLAADVSAFLQALRRHVLDQVTDGGAVRQPA